MVGILSQRTLAVDLEKGRREKARRNLAAFMRYWYVQRKRDLYWNWHLDYLCDILTAVTKRQLLRTIVNMPPRNLKSDSIVGWHAWMIGNCDEAKSSMLNTAAAAHLAVRDSRRTRDVLLSPWYHNLFPRVALTKRTDNEWETKGGCWRIAIGMDGTVTGRGAHHLVWDDLLLPKESYSEVCKTKARDFLGDTLRSRLDDPKHGTITGIQQRICEDDPTGYLLEQMKDKAADQYQVLTMPQEAERRTVVQFHGKIYKVREAGDLLQPERIGAKEWEAIKRAQPHSWKAQHQQDPLPGDTGELPPKDLVRIDEPAEAIARKWGLVPRFYLDLASTEKQTQKDNPDYSVVAVVARDELDRLWILDLWRGQVRHNHLLDRLIPLADKWKPQRVSAEEGGPRNSLLATYEERCRRMHRRPFVIDGLKPETDKVTRAQPLRALLLARQVHVPAAAVWLHDLCAEMARFPLSGHDDQVDALAYAALDARKIIKGASPLKVMAPGLGENDVGVTGADLEKMLAARERRMKAGAKTKIRW